MKLLYIVNFHAPMGGLHENVYSSALYMQKNKCEVYVVLKKGLLQQRMNDNGIKTIITDFSKLEDTMKSIEEIGVIFDLIHFHPGPSKYSALEYSKKYHIPLIETYHGTWLDGLQKHIHHLSAIITVSDGIKKHLQNRISDYNEKYHVMPNGYDTNLFSHPSFYLKNSKELNIALITRFDHDKQFIMDIMLLAINHLKQKSEIKLNINIIGSGTHIDEFIRISNTLIDPTFHTLNYEGWLVDQELKNAYLENDIVIAPARSAIEGMVSGKAVIAVGSKNYIGLIKEDNWQLGIHNNFGGAGNKFNDYAIGSIEKDLDHLLNNVDNIKYYGEFSYKVATEFFNADKINQNLLNLYNIILVGHKLNQNV